MAQCMATFQNLCSSAPVFWPEKWIYKISATPVARKTSYTLANTLSCVLAATIRNRLSPSKVRKILTVFALSIKSIVEVNRMILPLESAASNQCIQYVIFHPRLHMQQFAQKTSGKRCLQRGSSLRSLNTKVKHTKSILIYSDKEWR